MTKREFVQQMVLATTKKERSGMEAKHWTDDRWIDLFAKIDSIQLIANRIESERPSFFDKVMTTSSSWGGPR